MKIYYIILVCFIVGIINQNQNKYIKKNSEANFEILLGSKLSKTGLSYPVYRINVLNKIDTLELKDLDIQKILVLLDDKEYDWYLNLLLYDLTKKDAFLYYGLEINNREEWLKTLYKKDINFWKKRFDGIK